MADRKVVNEIEPPLLAALLDEYDRIFDAETKRLLDAADAVIENLRLEAIRTAAYRNLGRPKAAAA